MGLFLFIYFLFNNNFYRKFLDFSGIRPRIVCLEGEHTDHLTTTTALINITSIVNLNVMV